MENLNGLDMRPNKRSKLVIGGKNGVARTNKMYKLVIGGKNDVTGTNKIRDW